jgi:hypothetical protein
MCDQFDSKELYASVKNETIREYGGSKFEVQKNTVWRSENIVFCANSSNPQCTLSAVPLFTFHSLTYLFFPESLFM